MLDIIVAAKDAGASEHKLEDGTKVWAFTPQQLNVYTESIHTEGHRIIVRLRDQVEAYKIDARMQPKRIPNDPKIDL